MLPSAEPQHVGTPTSPISRLNSPACAHPETNASLRPHGSPTHGRGHRDSLDLQCRTLPFPSLMPVVRRFRGSRLSRPSDKTCRGSCHCCVVAHAAVSIRLLLFAGSGSRAGVTASSVLQDNPPSANRAAAFTRGRSWTLTIPFVVRPPPGTRVLCVTGRPEPPRVLCHGCGGGVDRVAVTAGDRRSVCS